MAYTKEQIQKTVAAIVRDFQLKSAAQALQTTPGKLAQYIASILVNKLEQLVKKNPKESKFVIDEKDPALLMEFFEWLTQNNIAFPKDHHYVIKRDGMSVRDIKGDVTVLYKPKKRSEKSRTAAYDDMLDTLAALSFVNRSESDDDLNDDAEVEHVQNAEHVQDAESDADDEEVEDPDFAAEYDDHKARGAITHEHSSRSKSSRTLHYQAKAALAKEAEERKAQAKQERQSTGEPTPAVRFENHRPKTEKKSNFVIRHGKRHIAKHPAEKPYQRTNDKKQPSVEDEIASLALRQQKAVVPHFQTRVEAIKLADSVQQKGFPSSFPKFALKK